MRSIGQVIAFLIGLGIAGAIGVTILHSCCRDGVVRTVPYLDGSQRYAQ